jgi:hypothetical protein
MTSQFETIDAETIKISYEDVSFSNDHGNSNDKNDLLGEGIQKAIDLDKKLYKNRYTIDRSDENLLPRIKMKKLDDKIYRPHCLRPASLIKDFEKHKIRSFKFSTI